MSKLFHLYLFGVPGRLGGAGTKIAHLIRLLQREVAITVVPPSVAHLSDKEAKELTQPYGIPVVLLKDLPKKLEGVALAVCELHFFTSGAAREAKTRGLRVIWSNEMMFPFKGEAEAVRELYENFPYRQKVSRQAAQHAREYLCNPEEHRRRWIEALSV